LAKQLIIAIDGPVASGKTTVGELAAKKLGYRFLDTGTMYRGITWLAWQRGIMSNDEEALGTLARSSAMRPASDAGGLTVNDTILTWELKSPQVEESVSRVAAVLDVRRALVAQQRSIARKGGIVMVGRDIGTDVLPDADLKVYLEASPQERARRRLLQIKEEGGDADYQRVLEELEARDRLDTQRTHSPLRPAPDAHPINTDGMALDQVVERILALLESSR